MTTPTLTPTRFYNALLGINLLLPWVMSMILRLIPNFALREILFFACVFLLAVGNARLAKLAPQHAKWIWALSLANLAAAIMAGHIALATLIPALLGLAA